MTNSRAPHPESTSPSKLFYGFTAGWLRLRKCIRRILRRGSRTEVRICRKGTFSTGVENGGRGEIRTHDRVTPTPDFESGAFNRSATRPRERAKLKDNLPTIRDKIQKDFFEFTGNTVLTHFEKSIGTTVDFFHSLAKGFIVRFF